MTFRYLAIDKSSHLGIKQPVQMLYLQGYSSARKSILYDIVLLVV